MKRRFINLIMVLGIFICNAQIIVYAVKNESGTRQFLSENKKMPRLQIPIISDVHISGEIQQLRFINALNDYKNTAPNYKAMAIVGDLTDHSYTLEYKQFMKILNENINSESEKVIAMGNHEFYDNNKYIDASQGKYLLNRFVELTGMDNTHYDKWIKGYHFIVLCTEESKVRSKAREDLDIVSDEQCTWLEDKLKEKADIKKPIFVFLHRPIKGTVYGSDEWGIGVNPNKLVKVLNKYPQVILFSGHSHYLLNHPRTVYQDGFTMVNTGSVAYTMAGGEKVVKELSQGLLLNVYDNEVEIKARDFTNHSWVNSYKIKLPYKKTIEDTKEPYFPNKAKITIDKVDRDSVTISWDAAKDNILIDKYLVMLKGKTIETKYIDFWKEPKDKRIQVTIDKLLPETQYEFNVFAKDAFNNRSEKPLKISVSTKQ